ncbi:MAG: RNase H [Candidatus Magasanikbacteria bacterium CG10_big_fil_rev_8_21_14_0_10_47_10]|uniref:RNase H n=1 Tax=Candidatus Magasanikbacteria bacterium CG10_big_fil_rev_8_21_14_0_10_47_10 TaxID=1974652 RepID=A0A2H0TS44_9BACT|nr:MAG: RNase H [Candidatus Magasanikbacteria bacterium CG10_big_fil_rev_8_21_14_0_10_47_10]
MKCIIYADGGSRGNPGPSASGVVIHDTAGKTLAAYGDFLGHQTNNYAEYSAIISGLKRAKTLGATSVECRLDSKLVVEQLNGRWKVKEPTLQKLFVQAYNALQEFKPWSIKHIRREYNKLADAEVNKTLDARM